MNPHSARLTFREFAEEDYSRFCSVFTNGAVMRYAYIDQFQGPEDCRAYFEQVLRNNAAAAGRTAFEFAVFSASGGSFIGFADILIHMKNELGGIGEIGYFLLPEAWGSGYATEIAAALTEFGFTALGLHRMEARCNANNAASENVMKKLGMVKEGELRQVRPKNGHWENELFYSILKEEWKTII